MGAATSQRHLVTASRIGIKRRAIIALCGSALNMVSAWRTAPCSIEIDARAKTSPLNTT